MRLMWTVAWREYRTRVSSPLFIILTALVFMLLVGGPIAAVYFFGAQATRPLELTVVDQTGQLLPRLQAAAAAGDAGPAGLPLGRVVLSGGNPADEAALRADAREGRIPGLLILSGAVPDQITATFASSSTVTLGRMQEQLRPLLQEVVREMRLAGRSVDPEVLAILEEPLTFQAIQLTTGEEGEGYGARMTVAWVFNFLMYMGILMYASYVFQGVLEEKVSRVMEVMVAAVKPTTLMAGKVLGLGLLGLTQLATWGLAYLVLLLVPLAAVSDAVQRVPVSALGYMVVYFILGYFLYAALYAAAASTISRMEDSQALLTPLVILVAIAYFISTFALTNPSSALTRWGSWIPFTSPTVMVSRLVIGQPPLWEVALSILLLLAAAVGFVWLGARVYRVGVLLYGARPTWRQIVRYLRAG